MYDIFQLISSSLHARLYADDCALFREIANKDYERDLNSAVNNAFKWHGTGR